MAVWDFVPNGMVVTNVAPEQAGNIEFNGWTFSAKPVVPWQYSFKIMLHGLMWFTNDSTGLYDNTTQPTVNARRFEEFVKTHGVHTAFTFPHPHLGNLECRFKTLPAVPAGMENAGGLIEAFEVELIHDNPAF